MLPQAPDYVDITIVIGCNMESWRYRRRLITKVSITIGGKKHCHPSKDLVLSCITSVRNTYCTLKNYTLESTAPAVKLRILSRWCRIMMILIMIGGRERFDFCISVRTIVWQSSVQERFVSDLSVPVSFVFGSKFREAVRFRVICDVLVRLRF